MTSESDIRGAFDRVADSAQRVGYAQAFVDILNELERVGESKALVAVALFGKSKGIGGNAPAATEVTA